MAGIKVDGLDKLEKALKKNATLDKVKKLVRENGKDLQKGIQVKADFEKGYQSGTTKRSVGLEFSDGGMTADSGPTTEYSPYVEWGTRFMQSQPFVRPALEEQGQKFKADLDELMK